MTGLGPWWTTQMIVLLVCMLALLGQPDCDTRGITDNDGPQREAFRDDYTRTPNDATTAIP